MRTDKFIGNNYLYTLFSSPFNESMVKSSSPITERYCSLTQYAVYHKKSKMNCHSRESGNPVKNDDLSQNPLLNIPTYRDITKIGTATLLNVGRIQKGFFLIMVLIVLIVNACSYPVEVLKMVPMETESMGYINTNKSIKIEMLQEKDKSNPLSFSGINNPSFQKALELSLIKSNLFIEVNTVENPDYTLKVMILSQEKPFHIFSVTVKLLVLYQLIDMYNGSELWNKSIFNECKKTVSDEFVGARREQRAYEGAAQGNIKQLIEELSKLYL